MNTDWVNPKIGNIGHLPTCTIPTVMRPHGMMQLFPIKNENTKDAYFSDYFHGFPIDLMLISPAAGDIDDNVDLFKSEFDNDLEIIKPYIYKNKLFTYDIDITASVSAHSSIFSFDYKNKKAKLLLRPTNESKIDFIDEKTIEITDTSRKVTRYIVFKFDSPIQSSSEFLAEREFLYRDVSPGQNNYCLTFGKKEILNFKVGLSLIDMKQAYYNLDKEIPDFNINKVADETKSFWDKELSKVEVEGSNDDYKIVFYTALYKNNYRMVNFSEYGRYHSGYDNLTHSDDGQEFYSNDGIWDTYRCMHPLQTILAPSRQEDIVQSLVRMYKHSGWMPSFPYIDKDRPVMIGFHANAVILDAYIKGLRNFDIEVAYEGMKKNSLQKSIIPWCNKPHTELDKFHAENGYFPALNIGETETIEEVDDFEDRQSVAVTLEHAYSDWCLARFAEELGKADDAEKFYNRSKNYQNLYNKKAGYMWPKNDKGEWVKPYNPKYCGGVGGRAYFAENNAYIYNFSVQHDIDGLKELMGGQDNFLKKLENLFVEQYSINNFAPDGEDPDGEGEVGMHANIDPLFPRAQEMGNKFSFLAQYPDATGLMGQFPMGNEPSFHIPYLFNYAGAPYKTQKYVRELIKLWFTNSPYGICGDEDGGAMSSWLAFSAIGLYPVCPGKPEYDITSPIFNKITLHLDNGNDFIIEADNAEKYKYIQKATLNGVELTKPRIKHTDIINGGKLVIELGESPNFDWGI